MKDHTIGHCPMVCEKLNGFMSRVGDRWSVLVILALDGMGMMRFNELKRHLGITQRMLSRTLRELERDGLVRRTVHDTVPPRVYYELTALGESFGDPIRYLGDWGLKHLEQIDAARAEFDAKHPD